MFGGRRRRERGNAVVEVALMAPWIFLLFLAIFSFGFFMYAGISVANAARAAVLQTARRNGDRLDPVLACTVVKEELKYLPNSAQFNGNCSAPPLIVTVGNGDNITDVPGKNPDGTNNGALLAARVEITYTSIQLFPLPFLKGIMTLTRQADMRVYQ